MVRVAAVQLDSDGVEPVADRIERVVEAVTDIASGGTGGLDVCAADDIDLDGRPDLIVLPELWTVGAFNTAAMLEHPESIPGDTVDRLVAIARDHALWLHAGAMPELTANGVRANTSVLIGPDGAIAATYRKLHLFGFDEGEAALLTAGTEQVVVPTVVGATALTTCYDLRFPELYRDLVAAGAETFVIPAGWPARRIEHWRVLLRARAIENQAFVVAANGVGEHAGVLLGGRSCVIDPWGDVIVEALPDRECLVLADLDPRMVATTREAFPVLRDRRDLAR